MARRHERREENVAVAIDKDKGSQYALKWAIEHCLSAGHHVTLLHVKTKPSSVPTPSTLRMHSKCIRNDTMEYLSYLHTSIFQDLFFQFLAHSVLLSFWINLHMDVAGSHVKISDVNGDVAKAYKHQVDSQAREVFLPFRCFCTRKNVKNSYFYVSSHI